MPRRSTCLRDREYVRLDKKRLHPEDKGRLVTAFLENFFRRYVEYDFTADLEEKLDLISAGKLAWKDVLRDFWRDFIAAVQDIGDLRITEVLDALNDMLGPHIFPEHRGRRRPARLSLLRCRAPQPQDRKVRRLHRLLQLSRLPFHPPARRGGDKTASLGSEGEAARHRSGDRARRDAAHRPLRALCPAWRGNGKEKPKRASIPKGTDPESLDLARALSLLSLPREIGAHPETGKPITAGFGRFGPYVQHDGKYASFRARRRGVQRWHQSRRQPACREGRQPQSAAARRVIKDLGEHPELEGAVQVLSGRYGPYVKHGKINATLPKDIGTLRRVTMARRGRADRRAKRQRSGQGTGKEARQSEQDRCQEVARKAKKRQQKEKQVVEETARAERRQWQRQGGSAPATVGKLPSKQEILDFLQAGSVKSGKREIARAFGVKGGDRVALKELLRSMADDGLIAGSRRKLVKPGALPPVTVIEIVVARP